MATEEDDWGVDNDDWGVDTDDWGPEVCMFRCFFVYQGA